MLRQLLSMYVPGLYKLPLLTIAPITQNANQVCSVVRKHCAVCIAAVATTTTTTTTTTAALPSPL